MDPAADVAGLGLSLPTNTAPGAVLWPRGTFRMSLTEHVPGYGAPTAPWPGGDAPVPHGPHPLRSNSSLCREMWGSWLSQRGMGQPATARRAASTPPSAHWERVKEQRKSCVGLAQCSFISMVWEEVLPPMGSNPLVQTFWVAHSHNPPWLLLALWLAAAPPAQQAWFPQRGQEDSLVFPSATYTALLLPKCRTAREGPATPWTWGGHSAPAGAATGQGGMPVGGCQVWAGRGASPKCRVGTFGPSWDPSRATPGGSVGSCMTAPCSDHFHQLGRDRSLRCKAESRLQGWMPKGGCA